MKTKTTLQHSYFMFKCSMIGAAFFVSSCQKNDVLDDVAVKSKTTEAAANGPGGGVMMQAFYWDCPAGGNWWNTVKAKVPAWNTAGFTAIWLPPAQKAQNGAFSMGYDPTDYFDFGQFNQSGSVETRFGSNTELDQLIATAHGQSLQVYADIVINHNSGGASELNPNTGQNTWTKYNVASGRFNRSYNDFHPIFRGEHPSGYDEGAFGGFPDLCHHQAYVQDQLWRNANSVSKSYKAKGFDGWRFDFVKGFGAWVVQNWVNYTGGFAVGEMWDGNAGVVKGWVDGTGRTSSAFDFPLYYAMNDAFNGNNFNALNNDVLWKRDAAKAVTFVSNHDTDIMGGGKYLAYAYIMTHEGYPCVFYQDYEAWLDKNKLNNLIWIHRNLGTGSTTNLWIDNDEYIARRNGYNGNPGLVVYLNNQNYSQSKRIQTNWPNSVIKDYTGHIGGTVTTDGSGWATITAPPRNTNFGYSVWSKQ